MVDHIMKDQPRLTAKTDFWNSVTFEIMDTIFRLFEIGCYLFIGWQIIQGSSSIGELVMLTTYTWYMRWPLSIIGDEMSAMRKNRAKYESLHSFLNTPQTVVNGSTPYTYEY